jgi:hypothetical protein
MLGMVVYHSVNAQLINSCNWTDGVNEDIYFAHGCNLLNLKIAPVEVANKFSVETQFHLGSMGFHAIDKWLTKEECKQIKKQYEVL